MELIHMTEDGILTGVERFFNDNGLKK